MLQLQKKRDSERDNYHFIRDGKICTVRKTDNSERSDSHEYTEGIVLFE
jgi:hypothetical protein